MTRNDLTAALVAALAACRSAAPETGGGTDGGTTTNGGGSGGASATTSDGTGVGDGMQGSTSTDGSTGAGTDGTGSTGDPSPDAWTPSFVTRSLVCKLISDTGIDDPTANATQTRFNLRGTDLGVPVVAGDRLYLFFGDTVGYRLIWDFGEDPDAVASVDAAAAQADVAVLCNELEFLVTPDVPSVAAGVDPSIERDFAGAAMAAPPGESVADYIAQPAAPGFPFMPGTFEVPAGGFADDDGVWLFYAGLAELSPRPRATLGFLARWEPSALPNEQIVRRVDARSGGALGGHFIQTAPVLLGDTVWMFGSGDYRFDGVYLARLARAALDDGDGTELFDPSTGSWLVADALTQDQREAITPIFDSDGVGEIGVQWVAAAQVFVAMYQRELHDADGNIVDNRVVLRTAARAEGPWSDVLTIVDMADPEFQAAHCCGATCVGEQLLHCAIAGLYGAYPLPMIDATAMGDGFVLDIPFVVSTWDPYNVALMRTQIAITPSSR